MQGTNVLSSVAPLSKPASTVMYSTFSDVYLIPLKFQVLRLLPQFLLI